MNDFLKKDQSSDCTNI